jgi:hypothetical protein
VSCAQHRPYVSAIADGELELVPPSTLAHARACRACECEVETHSLLTARLREAVARAPSRSGAGLRRPWAAAAVATLLVAAMVAGLAVWRGLGGQDDVLAAASAAQRPPQFHSMDEAAIGAWCERESGRPMPVVALPSLIPMGARADQIAGVRVVTVAYRTGAGSPVTVSWLDATPGRSSVVDRSAAGRMVLLVRSPSGTAVVTGDAPASTLRSIAAQLQAARSAAVQPVVS